MSAKTYARFGSKALVVGAVLALATGAASASSTQASPAREIARLQSSWGTDVVRTAQVIPGSHVLLVGTRNQSLLRTPTPRRWLGSAYPVVVMFVRPPGSTHTTIENKCASAMDIPMMEDFRD